MQQNFAHRLVCLETDWYIVHNIEVDYYTSSSLQQVNKIFDYYPSRQQYIKKLTSNPVTS